MRSFSGARSHALFLGALATAIFLRTAAVLGYPTILWTGDSRGYVRAAIELAPSQTRSTGYSLLLWALRPFHSFTAVAVAQHTIGILTGVIVYAVAFRYARRRWSPGRAGAVSALAAVPVLFAGDQLLMEHLLVSDSPFAFLMVAAVALLVWGEVGWKAGIGGGLLLGVAATVRTVALPLFAVLAVGLLLARVPWKIVAASVAAFALPLGAYAVWFKANHGEYALSSTSSAFLYGRTMGFADCAKIEPPPELVRFCPKAHDPAVAPSFAYMWTAASPFREFPGGVRNPEANRLASEFTRRAIKAQPADYLRVVLRDTFRGFAPGRDPYPTPWTERKYHFPRDIMHSPNRPEALWGKRIAARYVDGPYRSESDQAWADPVRGYQRHSRIPGPVLGAVFAIGLVGVAASFRDRGGSALLPWTMAAALLVVPAATADFDYRYVIPAIPLACMAAVIALAQDRKIWSPKTWSTTREAALPSSSEQNRS